MSALTHAADTERAGRPLGFLYGCSLDCRVKLSTDNVTGWRPLVEIHGVCRDEGCSIAPHLATAMYLRGSNKDRCQGSTAKDPRNKRQATRAVWITELSNGLEVTCSLCDTSHRVRDIPSSVFALPEPKEFIDTCAQSLTHEDDINSMAARWCQSGDCRAGCPEGHVVRNAGNLSKLFPNLCVRAGKRQLSNMLSASTKGPVAMTPQRNRLLNSTLYAPSDVDDQAQPGPPARRSGRSTGGGQASFMSMWECNDCGRTERLRYIRAKTGLSASAQEGPYGCTQKCVLNLARNSKRTHAYSTIRGVCRNTAHCALAPHVVKASTLRGKSKESCKNSMAGTLMEAVELVTWISKTNRAYRVTCSQCETSHAVPHVSLVLLQEPAPSAFADSNPCKIALVNAGVPEYSIARWCRSGDCRKDCPDGHIVRNGSLKEMSKVAPDLCRAAVHRLGLGALG